MKRLMLVMGMIFSVLSVSADENVLQTIEISPVKDTYSIVLVADKPVDVKKTVQASNKINIVLKDIRASKTLNTVYNNVSNVDTVNELISTIEPLPKTTPAGFIINTFPVSSPVCDIVPLIFDV